MATHEEVHEQLLSFIDNAMSRLVEFGKRLYKVETQVEGILKGHEGGTRDDLKERIDDLEKKLHEELQFTKQVKKQLSEEA